MAEVETLKQEIAQEYIKKFKSELGRFKSLAVFPIESKIKDIIVANKDIGEGFDGIEELGPWKNIINTVSPKVSEKIYLFIKEKKEILAIKNSEEELAVLKQEIISGVTQTPSSSPENTETDPNPVIPPWTPQGQESSDISDDQSPIPDAPKDEDDHTKENAIAGAAVGVWWGTARWVGGKAVEKWLEAKAEKVPTQKLKNTLDEFATMLERNADPSNIRYTKKMRANMWESAKIFREASESLDPDIMTTMIKRWELGNKLPMDVVKNMGITWKVADVLKKLSPETLEKLVKLNSPDEIKALLKSEGIVTAIPDDVLKALSKADDLVEAQLMIKVFTQMKSPKFLRVMKGLEGMGVVDVLFLGLDVYQFLQDRDTARVEAKINQIRSQNMMSQARYHLMVGISSFAIEAGILGGAYLGWCAIWWPLWIAIGLGLWAVSYAVDQAADRLYFDVKNFYLQNKENYLKQGRSQLKQAILQTTHNIKFWDTSLNEKVTAEIGAIPSVQKVETLKDAWETIIYLEECEKEDNGLLKYPLLLTQRNSWKPKTEFISSLTPEQKTEYTKQEEAINKKIQVRMSYIQKSYAQEKIVYGMKNANGMKYIAELLAQSSAYTTMKEQGMRDEKASFEQNKEAYKKNTLVSKEANAEKFAKIETIYKTDKTRFWELYRWALYYKNQMEAVPADDPEYQECQTILSNIIYLQSYYEYISFGTPIESDIDIGNFAFDEMDFNYIHSSLLTLDINNYTTKNLNTQQTKEFFLYEKNRKNMQKTIDVSDSLGQNVLYRVAKEIHGYTWANTADQLRSYFSMDKDNAHGIYFKDKWYINNDNALDMPIDIYALDDIGEVKEGEIDTVAQGIITSRFYQEKTHINSKSGTSTSWNTRKDFIDTPTETLDEQLMNEIQNSFKIILAEELFYKTNTKKKSVEESIVAYIKQQSVQVPESITQDESGQMHTSETTEQWYVELPFYLLIEAKKAGIGDLQYQVFSYVDWGIIACSNKIYAAYPIDFSQTKIQLTRTYIQAASENYDENTQAYIEYVDAAKDKYIKLLSYDNDAELGIRDDLDIPPEIMKSYRAKIQEWEDCKKNLLLLDPLNAKVLIEEKYEYYHQYFENTYTSILLVIAGFEKDKFKVFNDLDSAQYCDQIESASNVINKIAIDPSGNIDIKAIEEILSDNQQAVVSKAIKEEKIDGKTIAELAKDELSRPTALRAVKQLITSVLEIWFLEINGNDDITDVYLKNHKYGEHNNHESHPTEEQINEYFYAMVHQRFISNQKKSPIFDPLQHEISPRKIDIDVIKISTLTPQQAAISQKVIDIQKIIEKNKEDKYVWIDRWNIIFEIEKGTIASRWTSTAIDLVGDKKITIAGKEYTKTFVKVQWLDITVPLEEWIKLANLLNRFAHKYPWTTDFYFWSGANVWRYGIYKPINGGLDDWILSLDAIKENFPSLLDANNDVKPEFINYINQHTKWASTATPSFVQKYLPKNPRKAA